MAPPGGPLGRADPAPTIRAPKTTSPTTGPRGARPPRPGAAGGALPDRLLHSPDRRGRAGDGARPPGGRGLVPPRGAGELQRGLPGVHRDHPAAAARGDLAVRPLPRPPLAGQHRAPPAGGRVPGDVAPARARSAGSRGRPGSLAGAGAGPPLLPGRGPLWRHQPGPLPWTRLVAAPARPAAGGPADRIPPPGGIGGADRPRLRLPHPPRALAAMGRRARLLGALRAPPSRQSGRLRPGPAQHRARRHGPDGPGRAHRQPVERHPRPRRLELRGGLPALGAGERRADLPPPEGHHHRRPGPHRRRLRPGGELAADPDRRRVDGGALAGALAAAQRTGRRRGPAVSSRGRNSAPVLLSRPSGRTARTASPQETGMAYSLQREIADSQHFPRGGMTMMKLRALSSLLLVAAWPALAAAPPATPSFGESVEVNVVNVDVYAVDKAGRRVTGLGKDDFELLEDGKKVAISNFAVVEAGPPRPAAMPSAPAPAA